MKKDRIIKSIIGGASMMIGFVVIDKLFKAGLNKISENEIVVEEEPK